MGHCLSVCVCVVYTHVCVCACVYANCYINRSDYVMSMLSMHSYSRNTIQ